MKAVEKIENSHFVLSDFFPQNCAVDEIMAKIIVERKGLQMTSRCGAYVLHAG
jgi:hypothetical protein